MKVANKILAKMVEKKKGRVLLQKNSYVLVLTVNLPQLVTFSPITAQSFESLEPPIHA